jgi:UDP-N-acetylmuramoylalanine--D-glutamate ligase
VAVLMNITPDHLDRHGGFEGYVKAKRQIFHRQTKPRTAVVGVDDDTSRNIYEALTSADEQVVVAISGERAVPGGVYVQGGILIDDSDGKRTPAIDLREIASLPGSHNGQNAAAAYATCKALGVDPAVICACLRSFAGLAHRQQIVAVIDGVPYINDSKATNADAAAKALACYDRILWIAGGRAKEGGLAGLEPFYGRIAHAFLIGEAAEDFARVLEGHVPVSLSGTIAQAVTAARDAATRLPGSVVLLSPACASFDQFADFEKRGDAFVAAVKALPGERGEPANPGLRAGGTA